MGSGNLTFFTPLLIMFVLQTACDCWPLKYTASHKGNGASPLNFKTRRYGGTQTDRTDVAHKLAFGARQDGRTKRDVERTMFKSEDLSANDKPSLSRAVAPSRSMKRYKRNVAYQRMKLDLTIRRTKRELQNVTSRHEPSQVVTNPEPRPEFHVAIQEWSWAWYLHIYLFAVLYWLVAIVSLTFIVVNTRFCTSARKANAALKLSLHLSLLLFSVSRGLSISINPYDSRGIMGWTVTYLLWSAGFPIIVTSFGLLLLVLFDTTKLSLAPPRFHNFSLAIGIMGINFVVVMVTDVTVLLSAGSRAMMIICHVYLMIAGLSYTAGFLWVGQKISRTVTIHATDDKLRRLRSLINVSAVISLSLLGVQIYAAVAVFGVYSEPSDMIDPWPWYAVQTCLRILEIGMCIVISTLFHSSTDKKHNFPGRSVSSHFGNARVSPTVHEITVKQTESTETKL